MKSKFNDYDYTIDVFVPEEAAPTDGFPVIFVLDGQRYAKMMYEVMNSQLRNRQKTLVEPAIIVGIGHHEDDIPAQRFYDFTAPAAAYKIPERRGKKMNIERAGGAELFMQFMMEQLMPKIFEKYAVNPSKCSIYGHSLGGLFVLWSYVKYPSVFSKYTAISPSIWWNERELISLFESDHHSHHPLFVAVGECEGDMVDDAIHFTKLVQERALDYQVYIAKEENHASVVPTTMSRILRFLRE